MELPAAEGRCKMGARRSGFDFGRERAQWPVPFVGAAISRPPGARCAPLRPVSHSWTHAPADGMELPAAEGRFKSGVRRSGFDFGRERAQWPVPFVGAAVSRPPGAYYAPLHACSTRLGLVSGPPCAPLRSPSVFRPRSGPSALLRTPPRFCLERIKLHP